MQGKNPYTDKMMLKCFNIPAPLIGVLSSKIKDEQARVFVENFLEEETFQKMKKAGTMIWLYGVPNTGKSAIAALLVMNSRGKFNARSFFIHATVLQRWFEEDYWHGEERIRDKVAEVDVLVIDDIGSETSSFKKELIYDLMIQRSDSGKITILTSNFPFRDILKNKSPHILGKALRRIVPLEIKEKYPNVEQAEIKDLLFKTEKEKG